MKPKTLQYLLRNLDEFSHRNLHRIAISNLDDPDRQIFRWWHKKYRTPSKPFHDHVPEELIVEMLEDFYAANPSEIQKFYSQEIAALDDWDGTMPDDYEAEIQRRLGKINERNRVDLSRYKDDTELTEEEEKRILDSIGKELPGSKIAPTQRLRLDQDEFEDEFDS